MIEDSNLNQDGGQGPQALQDMPPKGAGLRSCFGCGADNPFGLQLKSYPRGDEVLARWKPQPHHSAGGAPVLYGGIIAALCDCHTMWTARYYWSMQDGIPASDHKKVRSLTRALKLEYLKPVPLDAEVELLARVTKVGRTSLTVSCEVRAGGILCATAETVGVRLPSKPTS